MYLSAKKGLLRLGLGILMDALSQEMRCPPFIILLIASLNHISIYFFDLTNYLENKYFLTYRILSVF
jgi:hypothetical protein